MRVSFIEEGFNAVDPVHVLGAAGRIGQAVVRALRALGVPVVPVVRDLRSWDATGLPGTARNADLLDSFALRGVLQDAVRVVSCASPHHTQSIINATQADTLLVLLGDARRYLRAPDRHGLLAMEGERTLLGSGRPGVMLHPTMIYGLPYNDPLQNILRWIRRLPVLPLPEGGMVKVQPIALYDVVRALLTALNRNWPQPTAFPIAGGRAVSMRDLVKALSEAAQVKSRPILPLPRQLMPMLTPFSMLPFLPEFSGDDLRNLAEDRSVETMTMLTKLGLRPLSLQEGLAAMLGR
jgi:uncharacterized protein YbjT (DUF2867 family)